MAKGDLHISRRFVHSDLNLTESDVKVITNNRIESPFRSMRDSHSVSSFTPDKGMSRARSPSMACAALPGEWWQSWTGWMLDTVDQHPANQRLARHLDHERPWMFTFLYCPGLDATNNVAERAIRGMVIARKVWGGSRTWEGARTQQVLVSVLRTCWQQGKDAFERMVSLLHARRSI